MSQARLYWWRPCSGTWRQRALDLRHLWTVDRVGRCRPPWRLRNFGDELTPQAFGVVAMEPAVWADAPRADLFLLGSVLQRAALEGRRGACVLGPGLAPGLSPALLARVRRRAAGLEIRAVRGPLTRDALGLSKRMALGDGALLLADRIPTLEGDGRGVVLAHYRALASPVRMATLRSTADRLGARLVFTADDVGDVMAAIASARFVVSTSLHGVVVADLAGVPVLAATETSRVIEDFRFSDYGASVGRPDLRLLPLAGVSRNDVEQSHAWSVPLDGLLQQRSAELAETLRSWVVAR